MRYYGGLWKKMPVTAICYGICMLAIAGASFPYSEWGMSGFYSKDGIIAGAVNCMATRWDWPGLAATGSKLFFWGPMCVAYVTVFYMARSFALTFLGKPRDQHLYDNAHEAPWQMTVPQIALAFMAFVSAPWGSSFYMPHWQRLIENSTRDTMIRFGVTSGCSPATSSSSATVLVYVHKWLIFGWGWVIGPGRGRGFLHAGHEVQLEGRRHSRGESDLHLVAQQVLLRRPLTTCSR